MILLNRLNCLIYMIMKYSSLIIIFITFLFATFKVNAQCTFNGVLSVSSDDSICSGDNYNLFATGALSYNWSPANLLSNPNISFPTTTPSQTTTFYVTAFDAAGCSAVDSVEIYVHSLPQAYAGEDTSICPGSTLQLNASGGIDYTWIVNDNLSNFLIFNPLASPSDTIEYIVNVKDSNNCSNNDTVVVNVFKNASANAGFNVSICANESYLLEASGGVSYQWEPSDFVNHPNSSSALAFPDDDMNFHVAVTDSNGCTDTDTVQILVFKINAFGDTTLCRGDSVQFDVLGDPATSFIWSPFEGVSDSSIYNPKVSPNNSTNYIITATNAIGCTFTDSVSIVVPNPIAIIDTLFTPGCNGVYVNFINSSSTSLDFKWNFSDNSFSSEIEFEKLFDFDSSFEAELTVEDSFGCTNTSTKSINTNAIDDYFDFSSFIYPNVFTPNSDGNNDLFEINVPGKIYECIDLIIYNKWGEVQFSSSGNNIKWDGYTNSGLAANQGTYYYTLSINNDTDKQKSGAIQLFR